MTPGKYSVIHELISLREKIAIVTGGATGIGYAISQRLAEAGAAVFIADLNFDEAQKACMELEGYGYKAVPVRCDVGREDEVKAMVEKVAVDGGGIDILVNNAGIYPRFSVEQMTGDDFERVMAVNLKGVFYCSREAGRRMIERGRGGCIINIISIDAFHPSAKGLLAYDTSKGGVLTFTKSLDFELGRHDIRVNAIAPGGILTPNLRSQLGGTSIGLGRAELKSFMSRTALGKMGVPDDIGRVALFLASDMAGYVTGSVIVADGGYLIS
jgi:NAD(P)-dependent dehydrogenase (short-subunit alcohol dehydrogenase family)